MTDTARRRFLAHSAALASAPLFSSAFAQAPARKLGVALCGLGSLATNQIAPALQKARNCRLAGIVTGTPSKAAEWQKKYDLPASSVYTYDTMTQMAKNKDIDIVYVVTPNALHMQHTLAAAAAGKHVYCEKPLEISVERCQKAAYSSVSDTACNSRRTISSACGSRRRRYSATSSSSTRTSASPSAIRRNGG